MGRLSTSRGVIFVALLIATAAMAVDPGEDFSGYMENMEQRRLDEEQYRAKLHAHEVCYDDVITGLLVTTVDV